MDREAGEIFTNLERLEEVLVAREGWRYIHKFKKAFRSSAG
jgi:hypothetical protein